MKLSLYDYIYNMARKEDKHHLFKPDYLRMDSDEEEAERVCSRCEKCYTPDDYCFQVISRIEDKELILSAGNRILDVLMRQGCHVMPEYFDTQSGHIDPEEGEVKFYWDSEHGEAFCRKCSQYGKQQCPEDVYDETCARNGTVRAIEQVISTVNELI